MIDMREEGMVCCDMFYERKAFECELAKFSSISSSTHASNIYTVACIRASGVIHECKNHTTILVFFLLHQSHAWNPWNPPHHSLLRLVQKKRPPHTTPRHGLLPLYYLNFTPPWCFDVASLSGRVVSTFQRVRQINRFILCVKMINELVNSVYL